MRRIDTHQHFWKFEPTRQTWIRDNMFILREDFLPEDIAPILNHYGVEGCISIQAEQTETENSFLLNLAESSPFIKGVVGWVDLTSPTVDERLEFYSGFPKMKGFRHMLQDEADPGYALKPEFIRGVSLLKKYDFTYDILVRQEQLACVAQLVKLLPEQQFVLNHLAKPQIKGKDRQAWERSISEVARHQNVSCKISGLVTETDWHKWHKNDFRPCLDVVFDHFGSQRVMFGSDWPVCRLSAFYGEVLDIAGTYFSQFTKEEQECFWSQNACRFYRL